MTDTQKICNYLDTLPLTKEEKTAIANTDLQSIKDLFVVDMPLSEVKAVIEEITKD